MESFKKLCVIVVLSMVTYGAYVTMTSKPPADDAPQGKTSAKSEPDKGRRKLPPMSTLSQPASPASMTNPAVATAPLSDSHPGAPPPPGGGQRIGSTLPSDDRGVQLAGGDATMPPAYLPQSGSGSTALPPLAATPANPPGTRDLVAVNPPGAMPAATAPAVSLATAQLSPGGIEPLTTPVPADAEYEADFRSAQELLSRNHLAEALLTLSPWYDDPRMPPARRPQLVELLDQLAGTVIYSRDHWLEPAYNVQPGDTLESIAEKYNVPANLLANINGVAPSQSLAPGESLKVVRGPFEASVKLGAHELTLWVRGRYAGRFAIGVGQDTQSLEGDYSVRDKQRNPAYYGPQAVVDADDPANPLGEQWIDLGNRIGLHGTNDPQTIGRTEGRGCVRLSERDIQDVGDILSVGSKVTIRR